MGFGEAVSTCFRKYVVFSGRARRSEYWYFMLCYVIVAIIANILDNILGLRTAVGQESASGVQANIGWLAVLVALVFLLPGIAVAIRRLHDTGRTGWWYLLVLIPCLGSIVLLIFYVMDSTGDNQYGPNPKGVAAQPGPAA